MEKKLLDKLLKRQEEGTFRSLSSFEGFIDFYSNDYLGLSTVSMMSESTRLGGTGSRLVSGNSPQAVESEAFLADHFNCEAALIFNSGYDANVGFFSSVPQRGDTVIYDECIHASIRDGIRLSFADSYSFKHNSVDDLSSKLQRIKGGAVYIIVEGLYSMDGDIPPLKAIVSETKKKGGYLIVDEAHSAGIFGQKGRGIVDALGLNDEVFARIVTFGKAFGAHGACVLGSQYLKDYLLNFAHSFIYTTALPPNEYSRIRQMVQLEGLENRRKQLQTNIRFFREKFKSKQLISEINSPIQMLRIKQNIDFDLLRQSLFQNRIAAKIMLSPTVKKGQECIRICIHSTNNESELKTLISILQNLGM